MTARRRRCFKVTSPVKWRDMWALRASLGNGVFVWRDFETTGVIWDIVPAPCTVGDGGGHAEIAVGMARAMRHMPLRTNPCVLQFVVHDDPLGSEAASVGARDDAMGCAWAEHMREHISLQVKATQTPALTRRIRCLLYGPPVKGQVPADEHAKWLEAIKGCEAHMDALGVHMRRLKGPGLLSWLQTWLGADPAPTMNNESDEGLFDLQGERDLAVRALNGMAVTVDPGQRRVHVGDRLWRAVHIDGLAETPTPGLLVYSAAGEGVVEHLPRHTTFVVTVVLHDQEMVQARITRTRDHPGQSPGRRRQRAACEEALKRMAHGESVFGLHMGCLIHAASGQELDHRMDAVLAALRVAGLSPVHPGEDHAHTDSFSMLLPGNFSPVLDQRPYRQRAHLTYGSHVAAVVPVYGPQRGSGRPGAVFFHRSGELLAYDPLHPDDRKKNAHTLILGPTGSGKTATVIALLLQALARHRPRLYLMSTLPTFDLLQAYAQDYGVTTQRARLHPYDGQPMSPFAGVWKGASASTVAAAVTAAAIMAGEGGTLPPHTRFRLQQAVEEAARTVEQGEHLDIHRVADALTHIAQSTHDAGLGQRADSLRYYASGVLGDMFNRPTPHLDDADMNVMDLGYLGRQGQEDARAVAVLAWLQRIQSVVEQPSAEGRPTIVVIDEAHAIVGHPLLAPYLASIAATWRTYGAWIWIATQSLRQFSDAARAVLNLCEWWLCLRLDKDEAASVAAFRDVSPDARRLLLETQARRGQFTEAVVLADAFPPTLCRVIAPPMALALAQTEQHEKAKRLTRMKEQGLPNELAAARYIARDIAHQRATAE